MAWTNVDLVTVNPNLEIIPEGDYDFQFLGAKYGERDPNRIEASATIATEGDFTGRKVFFSYPDPQRPRCDWSPRLVKRLTNALGVDVEMGEDPVSVLNKGAGFKFASSIKHSKATEEYPNPKSELDIFNVRPSA